MNSLTRAKPQSGFILASLLVSTFFIMLIGVVTTQLILNNLQIANNERSRLNAQFAADGAIDHALQEINQDFDWPGTTGEQPFYEDSKLRITFESSVQDDPSDTMIKYIDVTGRSYYPKSESTPRHIRKFRAELRAITSGDFSVVTGVGGLIMTNSARILGGNVFVNGEITMSNFSQIGLTTAPVEVRAAHQNCPSPANATYPRVCASGENGEPITLNNSARIYGQVKATNQVSGANMLNPGLVPGSPAPEDLPTHDRAAQVAAISTTRTGSDAGCNNGVKTWVANTKITGNVTVSNTCTVTVSGDVWISGNFSLSNSAKLVVAEGLTEPPVVMIDGSSGLSAANNSDLKSNSGSVGFRVITYYSEASCSPDCADVTGSDLFDSRDHVTISLGNNSQGAETEFYSRWTRVTINNAGNIGALIGQTVELTNSSSITFGSSISGFGGISAWVLKSYKRVF